MKYDRERLAALAERCRQTGNEDDAYKPVMDATANIFQAYSELRPLDSNSLGQLTTRLDEYADLTERSLDAWNEEPDEEPA